MEIKKQTISDGSQQFADKIINNYHLQPESLVKSEPAKLFNVPIPRNPFFTGRSDILAKLYEALQSENEIAITPSKKATALSGLGGVGKTQTVAEYAHRYQAEYSAVLWVLADGKDLLRSSFAQLSVLLGFKAEKQDDQILAVQSWLRNNDGWLLIFDNAETLELLTAAKELLPTNVQGHVLFTTRAQATGGLASVTVDCFDDDTGAVFLLRRSKQVAMDLATLEQVRPCVSAKDWQTATELVHELGGLALAIDQAGAYIEQTECGLEGYLSRYRTDAATMLKDCDYVNYSTNHNDVVYKTFLLALKNVENRSELAGEILCLSAFLHPDGIPEEIFASYEPLELDKALAALKDYSLIQRISTERLFRVHHLVQIVARDVCHIDETAPTKWVEKAILAVNQLLPAMKFENWSLYERLLLSGLVCANWITHYRIENIQAGRLLYKIGLYLKNVKADDKQAERLIQNSLVVRKNVLGQEHLDVAESLNSLAVLCKEQGKYEQAELRYQESLTIREKILGQNHPIVAKSLSNLALLYYRQGKYKKAECLLQRSLVIRENELEENDSDVDKALILLGELYVTLGKYEQAESLFQRSLAIRKEIYKQDHPNIIGSLSDLGDLYRILGKYEQAEPLLQQCLAFREKILDSDSPRIASSLVRLAMLYKDQGKYEHAESLLLRALSIREKSFEQGHRVITAARTYRRLAELYNAQEKYDQAEPLFYKSLEITETVLGQEHTDIAHCLNGLADIYRAQEKYEQAETSYQQSLTIWETALGENHPYVGKSLHGLAKLYLVQGKYEQAKSFFMGGLEIYEKAFGTEHPETKTVRVNLEALQAEKRSLLSMP